LFLLAVPPLMNSKAIVGLVRHDFQYRGLPVRVPQVPHGECLSECGLGGRRAGRERERARRAGQQREAVVVELARHALGIHADEEGWLVGGERDRELTMRRSRARGRGARRDLGLDVGPGQRAALVLGQEQLVLHGGAAVLQPEEQETFVPRRAEPRHRAGRNALRAACLGREA
jgi:hypothetical protein